jgi:hypothetical protein
MSEKLSGPSRRAVLRGAAWGAPAIVVVAAAPAVAASGPASVTTAVSAVRNPNNVTVTIVLSNANTGTTGPITLALTAAPTVGTAANNANVRPASSEGWTYVDRTNGPDGARIYNFTNATGVPAQQTSSGPAGTSTLVARFGINDVDGASAGSLSVAVGVTSGSASGGSGSWS